MTTVNVHTVLIKKVCLFVDVFAALTTFQWMTLYASANQNEFKSIPSQRPMIL
jgi:hypothetical protein